MHRLLVVLLLYAGCAFGITAPDPDQPRSKMPVCDTGKGPVVLDSAVAIVAGIVALSLVEEEAGLALLPASIGSLYLAGAIKGNSSANKCRKAMGEYESYLASRATLPPDDEPRARRTASAPEPGPEPAAVAPPPAPVAAPLVAPASAPVAPAPAAPSTPAPVATAQPAPPQPKPARPVRDDAWSDFWREVE